jgi:hypothetical protein
MQRLLKYEASRRMNPPATALQSAYIAASLELSGSTMILIVLLTRVNASALLGMTAVIENFVYPMA